MMLKLLGDEVHTAHDGFEAVEAAQSFRPQVILMDVGMPRLNGYEATPASKSSRGEGQRPSSPLPAGPRTGLASVTRSRI